MSTVGVQLIYYGEGFVPIEYGDLIHSDLGAPLEGTMGQAIVHHELNDSKDTTPARFEELECFLLESSSGPSGQKHLVSGGHALFRVGSREFALNPIPGNFTRLGAYRETTR